MKMNPVLVLLLGALLPAQAPQKPKPAGKPAPAAAVAPAAAHASLADLQRDFQEKKFAAIDAYVKAHADAADVGAAIVEGVTLAQAIGQSGHALRLADLYLGRFAEGEHALAMHMARGSALRGSGDAAGAKQAFEQVIDKAGDDIDALVNAATTLAEMLCDSGKQAEAVELLGVVGASRPRVRGLKEHMQGIADSYKLIGTEPMAIVGADTAGKAIDLAEYKGKVLLIDFWATWCGPCIGELPNVIAAYEKYHAKGFEILGISLDQDRAAFDRMVADRKMTWRHQFDGKGWQNEIAVAWGIKSIPATYLIGADGKIVATGLRGDQLANRLATLLGAKK